MSISRRSFLKYCGAIAATVGIDPLDLGLLQQALADPNAPSVVWLHGSSCTGCSVSLLNRISDKVGEPATITDVLTDAINLVYHPTLMALAGEGAGAELRQVYEKGDYILVVEGGVPMAFNGHCCVAYSFNGEEVTYKEAVLKHATRASHVVCAGTCSSFGGIPKAGQNPTDVISVSELLGQPTINISGCPANPDWIVWAIVQILLKTAVELDDDNRPKALYNTDVDGVLADPLIHAKCPRKGNAEATSFTSADTSANNQCLVRLGCRGPDTKARCRDCWNGIAGEANWCIGVNAPCHGCTEKTFPGPEGFYSQYSTI
jgi:hydrogenase small subunit